MHTIPPDKNPTTFDVVVAGAGAAGVAAALGSCREGARTLLLARRPLLGGTPSSFLIHSLSGLYLPGSDALPRLANAGVCWEFIERLRANGGGDGPVRIDNEDVFLRDPGAFARLCEDLCAREKLLTVRREISIDQVETGSSGIQSILLENDPSPLRGRIFIDATRDAELSFLSGATLLGERTAVGRRSAFVFVISEPHAEAPDHELLAQVSAQVIDGVRSGELNPKLAMCVIRAPGFGGDMRPVIDLDTEGDHYSTLQPGNVLRLQILGSNLAAELEAMLRSKVPSLRDCRVALHPAVPHPRATRRVRGRLVLSNADSTPDANTVCWLAWGRGLAVPLRALMSADFQNLLMAGRCLSADWELQPRLRVAGAALATGEAAGRSGAAIALSGCDSLNPTTEEVIATRVRHSILEQLN